MAGHFCGKQGSESLSTSTSDSSSSDCASTSVRKIAKRQVTVATFDKWQRQFDRDYQSLLWLQCTKDRSDSSLVSTLWCDVCRQYEAKITGMRNFSLAWITGSTNHKTSNILDHAKSEKHARSMACMRTACAKAQNKLIETYAPIVCLLTTMDEEEKTRMRYKCEICYVLAREGLAFHKYPTFHSLVERQGVRLGSSYRGCDSAKLFTYYIAEAQRSVFLQSLSQINFFSFLMDGSTDAGNKEQELVFWCFVEKMTTQGSNTRYLTVLNPVSTTSEGLVDCLDDAMKRLDITIQQKESVLNTGCRPVLGGGGTDGASVNICVHSGMKSRMQEVLPWLFWAWCFSHRLELACKDAFKSSLFTEIDDMLLRFFYLHKNSPKKMKELATIGEELNEVFHFLKGGSGSAPVCCQGTRWITHKRRAMQRIVDRFGAYIQHLTGMVNDSSVKPSDKAKH